MIGTKITSLLFAIGVYAVDVANYGSHNCGNMMISSCPNLEEWACCAFEDGYRTPEGVQIVSGTSSVEWLNLQECDVGTWFRPSVRPRAPCGFSIGSVIGPANRICQSYGGQAYRRDGAKWFNVVDTLTDPEHYKKCPYGPGVVEALPNPDFKIAFNSHKQLQSGIDVPFPAHWAAGSMSKRHVTGRSSSEPSTDVSGDDGIEESTCKSVQYANVYHWVGEDSVYVLKGSKETHDALGEYHTASEPKPTYEDTLQSLGAQHYEDWRQCDELRRMMGGRGQSRMARDADENVVSATPAAAGASSEPMDVKDTLE